MSNAETKARWFRVYSANRKIRKAVGANTLEQLISEGIQCNVLHVVFLVIVSCLEFAV